MLFREFACFGGAAPLDCINDGSMLFDRSLRLGPDSQGDHAGPVRLIHDRVIHPQKALVAAVLNEQFVKRLIRLGPGG